MRRHPVRAALTCTAVIFGFPAFAFARQAGLPGPPVEVGIDVIARSENAGGHGALGPHLTINLSPRTAIELSGDLVTHKSTFQSGSWADSRSMYVQLRRALYQRDGFTVAATAGGGLRQDRHSFSGYTLSYKGQSTVVAPRYAVYNWPAVVTGLGLEQRIGGHASIRGDVQVPITHEGIYPRVLAGVSVPLGRYPTLEGVRRPLERGVAELRTGQHVWITTNEGREISGAVGAVSDTGAEIRRGSNVEVVELSAIRRIQIPDSLTDGVKIGAAVGGGIAGGMSALALLACDGDCDYAAAFVIVFTGLGVGMGSIIGALSDSLHETRHTVFDASTTAHARVVVAPIVQRRGAGAGATITWR